MRYPIYVVLIACFAGVNAQTAGAAETLPVCIKCLNPRVISKTGFGTASAAADAKVVAEDATPWCAANRSRDPGCVRFEVQQGGDGARNSFRATANCATGELHSMHGDDFVYAGLWEDGAGKGRPKFRQPPQNNVPQWESIRSGYGKARSEWDLYGGYSLAGQWEVLCGKAAPQVSASPAKPAAVRTQAAPAEKEWLSLCSRCDNPTVFAKSGIGTANAVAQARSPETGNKVYRASANCTTGRITTAQEKSYTLAGIWDNSDIGGGRTKWKGADGRIEPRDNASDGLAIAQQWELLCPGPVAPALLAQAAGGGVRMQAPVADAPAPPAATAPAAVASACTGKRFCDETPSFAAIITDFRPSTYDNNTRMVSATVRFLNKTNRPLILGYLRSAGIAIDEQGNRYIIGGPENVRGIGEIGAGREFDPKFTVPPGQTADARFEFLWRWNGRDVIGQRAWDVDLAVREVAQVAPGQYRFGQEHALQFKSVPGRSAAAAVNAAEPAPGATPQQTSQPAAPVTQSAPPVPALPDACGGRPKCYDAGPFVAEIAQLTVFRQGTSIEDRVARLNIRFRNKTNTPLTLGYVAGTSVLVDNFGKRFFWGSGHDTSATGIGIVEGSKADTQFVLAPGETRAATFTLYRKRPPRTDPDGTGYTYDVTIAQLEVLYNGQQVRTTREHTMTFPDFAPNGPGAGALAAPAGGRPTPQSIKEAGESLRDVFRKKK